MKSFLVCVALMVMLCACQQAGNTGKDVNHAADSLATINVKYATGFTVRDSANVRLVDVGENDHFALVRNEDDRVPEGYIKVKVPIQRTICMTALQLSNFTILEAHDVVKGITGTKNLFNEDILARVKDGRMVKIGMEGEFDTELVMAANPDVIFISPSKRGGYDAIKETGITLVPHLGYKELDPLGQAEWIKFIGMFIGKEKEANELFAGIEQRYNDLKAKVADVAQRPTVTSGEMHYGNWHAVGGKNYLAQIFQTYMNTDGTINRNAPGVPLILTTADGYTADQLDGLKGRNTIGDVLDQAKKDLEAAVVNLEGANYKRPSKNYIDLSVARGLLARFYLLTQQWDAAATTARAARQGYTQRDNAALHDGFMRVTASDVMWGFAHNSETQTAYASFFSHISNLAPGYAGLGYSAKLIDKRLYDQIPDDDYRKTLFNGPEGDASQPTAGAKLPYANLKFGNDGSWTMHYIYMRAAEMVLIEAEALARQGKNAEAATVMAELMKNRQPSWNKASVTVDDVLLQRRIELWGEGFSYFDLKRNNKGIDRNYEGSNHQAGYLHTIPAFDVRWTYQIPQSEMQENSHIQDSEQNP